MNHAIGIHMLSPACLRIVVLLTICKLPLHAYASSEWKVDHQTGGHPGAQIERGFVHLANGGIRVLVQPFGQTRGDLRAVTLAKPEAEPQWRAVVAAYRAPPGNAPHTVCRPVPQGRCDRARYSWDCISSRRLAVRSNSNRSRSP